MSEIPTIDELRVIADFSEADYAAWFNSTIVEIGDLLREHAKDILLGEPITYTVGEDNGKWDEKDNYSDKYKLFKHHCAKIGIYLDGKGYKVAILRFNDYPAFSIRLKDA